MHVQFKDQGIAMKYESLIIAIYATGEENGYWKGMDPLGFGNADTYGRFVEASEEDFTEGKIRFAAAMGGLAYQFRTEEDCEEIRNIILNISKAKTQEDIINLIDQSVELVERLKSR
jgi:hypothetical protein